MRGTLRALFLETKRRIANVFMEGNQKTITEKKESRLRKGLSKRAASLQAAGWLLPLLLIAALLVMFLAGLAMFFATVKGPEKVLVPNVEGKTLENAMLEMQVRELYPKIQLRYTDNPADEGTILSQEPKAGAIVKAGKRINLTVSRGVILDHVENYVGKNFESEQIRLQALFAGSNKPLIVFAEPTYKADNAEAGTILAQEPEEGTEIANPVTVKLVVSRGPAFEQTKVPNLIGLNVNDVLALMARTRIVFEFSAHVASGDERAGTVTSQQTLDGDSVRNYSRMMADFAMPGGRTDSTVYGIFAYQAQNYPYPVAMELTALTKDGDSYSIVKLNHTGGKVTIPYAVPAETTLILKVINSEVARQIIN